MMEVIMATRQQEPIRRKDTIRCPYCGEDYSVTYRRCPFCDGKPQRGGGAEGDDAASGGSRSTSGGKRLVTNKRGGGYGGSMEPVQIIGLALSIALIIAALYIVYTVVSPLLGWGKKQPGTVSGSGQQSTSQNQPGSTTGSGSQTPGGSTVTPPSPGTSTNPPSPGSSGTQTPTPPPSSKVTAIILSNHRNGDMTLGPGSSHQITATLVGGDGTETVTWTSSNTSAVTVDATGKVTNVNKGSKRATATITATCGDVSVTTIVRADPTGTGTTTPSTPGTGEGNGTVNAASGLWVRSGPGTTYEKLTSLANGAAVNIVEDTGTGWYKISFTNKDGEPSIGYVSKDFVKVNG